jgi:hypothetical protein
MHLPASGGEGLRLIAGLEHTNSHFSAVKGDRAEDAYRLSLQQGTEAFYSSVMGSKAVGVGRGPKLSRHSSGTG